MEDPQEPYDAEKPQREYSREMEGRQVQKRQHKRRERDNHQHSVHNIPPVVPVVFEPVADLLGYHLKKEDDGTRHVQPEECRMVDSRFLEIDNNRIKQNDHQNDVVVQQGFVQEFPHNQKILCCPSAAIIFLPKCL